MHWINQLGIIYKVCTPKTSLPFFYITQKGSFIDLIPFKRGGKMCQIVEEHNITVPQKKWGGAEWVYLLSNF